VNAPQAVAAIVARVAELAQPPTAVVELSKRFGVQLSAAATVPATDAGARVAVSAATVRTDTTMNTPRSAGDASGVWVDRIPNERGKALAPAIAAAAEKYHLEPAFLAAVYWTESAYTSDAVSRTGAIGLGQLMPETAAWLGVDPWDPLQNIDGSARLYRSFLDQNNGDMRLAIASYAAGPGAVKRAGGVPDQFTANYITLLLARTDYLAGRRATPP
jgi:soluble lytic murein transglycosylase-like protein